MLINYLINNINNCPNKIFFTYKDKDITYEKISYYISQRAVSLQNFGIKQKEIVGIYLDHPDEILEIFFSCLLIGSIPVILPYNLKKYELNQITNEINFSLIVSSWDKLKQVKLTQVITCPIEELSHSSFVCSIKDIKSDLKNHETQLILLTSGTTGSPKAVELSAKNLIENSKSWNKIINFTEKDTFLCCLPLSHIGGLSVIIRSIIYKCNILMFDKFDATKIVNECQSKNNLISVVPSMLNELVKTKEGINVTNKFRAIIMGGGPASDNLLNKIIKFNLPVYKSYGMTETSSGICGFWINDNVDKKQSVGIVHNNVEIKIQHDLLHIKSPMVMNGYYNTKSLQWFNTNDMAKVDKDNFIYIVMRSNGKIISGGENIDTNEIEKILSRHPLVNNVQVVGIPDDRWGQKLTAYVESDNVEKNDIINWAKKYLSKHKIPKEIIINKGVS